MWFLQPDKSDNHISYPESEWTLSWKNRFSAISNGVRALVNWVVWWVTQWIPGAVMWVSEPVVRHMTGSNMVHHIIWDAKNGIHYWRAGFFGILLALSTYYTPTYFHKALDQYISSLPDVEQIETNTSEITNIENLISPESLESFIYNTPEFQNLDEWAISKFIANIWSDYISMQEFSNSLDDTNKLVTKKEFSEIFANFLFNHYTKLLNENESKLTNLNIDLWTKDIIATVLGKVSQWDLVNRYADVESSQYTVFHSYKVEVSTDGNRIEFLSNHWVEFEISIDEIMEYNKDKPLTYKDKLKLAQEIWYILLWIQWILEILWLILFAKNARDEELWALRPLTDKGFADLKDPWNTTNRLVNQDWDKDWVLEKDSENAHRNWTYLKYLLQKLDMLDESTRKIAINRIANTPLYHNYWKLLLPILESLFQSKTAFSSTASRMVSTVQQVKNEEGDEDENK